jgi:hypothetical protein
MSQLPSPEELDSEGHAIRREIVMCLGIGEAAFYETSRFCDLIDIFLVLETTAELRSELAAELAREQVSGHSGSTPGRASAIAAEMRRLVVKMRPLLWRGDLARSFGILLRLQTMTIEAYRLAEVIREPSDLRSLLKAQQRRLMQERKILRNTYRLLVGSREDEGRRRSR